MVFQSTIPVAFGLAFTTWELDTLRRPVGGARARRRRRRVLGPAPAGTLQLPAILAWGALYAVFPLYVVLA